jgi:hypothetical protein
VPWPVYTERLLAASVTGVWVTWTVPAGKRAIVKSVAAMVSAGAPGKVHVTAATVYIAAFTIPDLYRSQTLDLLAVVYAGEELRAYNEAPAGYMLVSGWLLDDPVGRATSDLEPTQRPELPPPGAELAPDPRVTGPPSST